MTDLVEPAVKPISTGAIIWLVPALALLVCLWLAWDSHNARGVAVEVIFSTGDGIEAGKTGGIYKGITVGVVRTLRLVNDDQGKQVVVATLDIKKEFEDNLLDTTKFWLVKPSVTLAGVTGLETLVSGNYIGVSVGAGAPRQSFFALDEEPSTVDTQVGLHLTLTSTSLGSLHKGSPVFYKQIQVGHVTGYHLSPNEDAVKITVFIKADYASLVKKSSIFWNASGISLDANLTGIRLKTESFTSIISGGIAFSTPETTKSEDPVDSSIPFILYENYESAKVGVEVKVRFARYDGLQAQKTPVLYKGIQLGVVKSLAFTPGLKEAEALLSLDPLLAPYLVEGTDFWLVQPSVSLSGVNGLDALVKGNYISLRLGKKESSKKSVFKALLNPLPDELIGSGVRVHLVADRLGALTVGSPLLYKQIRVGSVEGYHFSPDQNSVLIDAALDSEYSSLVNDSSRFWHSGGISVSADFSGIKFNTESLQSLLIGSISFDTPQPKEKLTSSKSRFKLHPTAESATKEGESISIHVDRGDGLVAGTVIRYRGLEVGRVDEVNLSDNLQGVDLTARITRAADRIVRAGTRFRIVRPELGLLKTANLDTLITGPYLEVYPGRLDAARQTRFIGIEQQNQPLEAQGLVLTLSSPRLGSIRPTQHVTYRDVVVGKVLSYELGPQADRVLIKILIEPRFASLVHSGSRFWENSGITADFSLLEGAKVRTESLQALVEGGIAFATPEGDAMGRQALAGQTFLLAKTPKDEWLTWMPKIPIESH